MAHMKGPKVHCKNMNHGRMNPPICYCPTCGDRFASAAAPSRCDEGKHGVRRKDRNFFCYDCGKSLIPVGK